MTVSKPCGIPGLQTHGRPVDLKRPLWGFDFGIAAQVGSETQCDKPRPAHRHDFCRVLLLLLDPLIANSVVPERRRQPGRRQPPAQVQRLGGDQDSREQTRLLR